MDQVVPQLLQQSNFHDLYFQQDVVSAHYSRAVWEYRDETFSEKWIGRRGSIDLPARSSDLIPMDFFFCAVLKNEVFHGKPRSVNDLKNFIRDAFQEINEQRDLSKNLYQSKSVEFKVEKIVMDSSWSKCRYKILVLKCYCTQ